MSSMSYLARDIASRLHHCGSYVDQHYTGLTADLRDIAATEMADQAVAFAARRVEILAGYGMMMSDDPKQKPFAYADGVAIIPIHGLLINRLSWSCSYMTGYNFIRSQRLAALADPDVKMIVYDVNSPGGIASGCAELAREMFDSRGEKPSLAVVDARCYSAAYFLASAADRIVVTPSGGVGSIGCVAMHVDYSDMLAEEGVKITMIFAGSEKVDGNPYERLSNRAKASIQRDVDYHYGLFVEAVSRHRDLSEEEVRSTEAGSFLPPEALDIGLIDAIETPAEAVANFFNEITSDADAGDDEMTTKQEAPVAATTPITAAASPPAVTQADIDATVARQVSQALAAEKARARGIKSSAEAAGRETLATHLADETSLSVEDAVAILAAAPKAVATDTRREATGFVAAMNATPNPEVGADSAGEGIALENADPVVIGNRLMQNFTRVTGRKMIAAA